MSRHLTTVTRLEGIINRVDIRIVDCRWYLEEPERGEEEYRRGHIPGATYASLGTDLSGASGPGRHPLPTPEAFAATLQQLGITSTTPVIVYDDRGGAVASRLWWMLTDQGHANTTVLDGGIEAWIARGNALTDVTDRPPAGTLATRPWHGIVERAMVASRKPNTVLIDARATERYRGDDEPVDPKAGHIPGARSLPQTDNLAPDSTFLSTEGLQSRFTEIGVTDASDVIAYCGSGVTACHNILAMEIAGFGRPDLYVGSWSDWSSSELPVGVGDTP